VVFSGQNTWKNSPDWSKRGYVSPDRRGSLALAQGIHRLAAVLAAKEPLGFGLVLAIQGGDCRLLPAHRGQE